MIFGLIILDKPIVKSCFHSFPSLYNSNNDTLLNKQSLFLLLFVLLLLLLGGLLLAAKLLLEAPAFVLEDLELHALVAWLDLGRLHQLDGKLAHVGQQDGGVLGLDKVNPVTEVQELVT